MAETSKISGGDKLGAALRDISSKVSKAATLQVGFLEGSTEADGTSIPMIAAIHEYGAPRAGIPPRPYFRTMIEAHSKEWPGTISTILNQTKFDSEKALKQTGEVISAELRQSIIDLNSPPLSPITVMLRGMRTQKRYRDLGFWKRYAIARQRVEDGLTNYGASMKPLVDTGTMLRSVDYTVK